MELKINLDSREEIGAAIALLQFVHEQTESTADSLARAGYTVTPAVPVVRGTPDLKPPTPGGVIAYEDRPDVGEIPAAELLGGAPVHLPPGVQPLAPSIAAAVPLPTAPAAPAATLPSPGALPAPVLPTVPSGAALLAPVNLTPTAGAPVVDLDEAGIPWDDRIHAGSKAKIANGTWKAKKGLNDPALIARVTEELKARVAAGASPRQVHVAQQVAAPLLPVPSPAGGAGVAPLPSPIAAELPAPAGAVLPAGDPNTFEQLMPRLTGAIVSGVFGPTVPNDVCVAHGLASINALRDVPQHIPQIWAYLKAQYPSLL